MKRNYLAIKLFHIATLTVLDIRLSVVSPIVTFVQIFDYCAISHGILNRFFPIDIYLYILIEENIILS